MTTGDSESPSSHSRGGDSGSDVPSSRSNRNGTKESTKPKKNDVTKIVQVANIAPQATREQMQTLFGYIGKIDDLRLYPTIDLGMHVSSKICFVKFYESTSVGVAQHLTNTVFIDRALIVIPYVDGEIPDEQKALELLGSGTLLPGIADPKLPQHVTSQLEGIPPHQVVITTDPKLIESHLPCYPPLPPTYDTRKIEEIRRTVVVANVDSELGSQDVVDYFSQAGEVKYFRFCTRDNDPLHYALIEFSDQPAILDAIKLNGTTLGTKVIKVYHATQAIIKPQAKTNEAAQKEIEEAMSRQAQSLLSQGLDGTGKDKRRSRSRSRRRSRSRGRRRSRSKSRRRTRSRSRQRSSSHHRDRNYRAKVKKSRSRSRPRRRSRSKKRSRSRGRSRRSRSRSQPKRSRSRSRKREEKKKAKKDKDRDREREKDKERDKDRDHKENGVRESKLDTKEDGERDRDREMKKPDTRSKSPRTESKRRRRSRSGSRPIKLRSSSHEKKRSKSKKKKKERSDRESESEERRRSNSDSEEKRSKIEECKDASDVSEQTGEHVSVRRKGENITFDESGIAE